MDKKMKFRMEIKEVAPDGTFEGILSPYGIKDQGGDIVEKGAYTKTLKDQGHTRPLLWQHKTDEPIGMLELEDRIDGLWCKGQILTDLPMGKVAYTVIKAGVIKGLSIGFSTVKDKIEKGVRYLKEIKLYEGSIVTFPMAVDAIITSVKVRAAGALTEEQIAAGEVKGDFNEELVEIQLCDAGWQMRCALNSALSSLFYSSLSKDEIVTAADTIIQQFSDAYLVYLPVYIDMLTEMYGDMETFAKKDQERKAGAAISTASKTTIQSGLDQIAAGVSTLSALIAEKAAEGTSTEQAAVSETKHEPVEVDHSALQPVLSEILSLTKI